MFKPLLQTLSAALLGALVLAGFSATADAQVPCGPRGPMLQHMEGKYSAHPRAQARMRGRRMLEIVRNEDGTWAALVTHINGTSCMVADGENWREIDPPLKMALDEVMS